MLTGGPALWAIAALSVVTMALILWKLWDMARLGAWSRGPAEAAVAAWRSGAGQGALAPLAGRRGLRARVLRCAIQARLDPALTDDHAREETARVAKSALMQTRRGLRALELIATIAPYDRAFGHGSGHDRGVSGATKLPATAPTPQRLAGGIWQALLTNGGGDGGGDPGLHGA